MLLNHCMSSCPYDTDTVLHTILLFVRVINSLVYSTYLSIPVSICSIVWRFLRTCDLPYCSLYDVGYTSIGNIKNTVPNEALRKGDGSGEFRPAYELEDPNLERSNRISGNNASYKNQNNVSASSACNTNSI